MRTFENFLARVLSDDMGKLILRLLLGLMLFHGYKKYVHGIEWIKVLVVKNGLPEVLAYGVHLGEIVAPVLIIIGLYTRISSLIYGINMGFAIYLVYPSQLLEISKVTGGLIIESPLVYLLGAVVLMFIGAGRFSLDKR